MEYGSVHIVPLACVLFALSDKDVYLQTTIRAATGLIKSGLTDPKALKEADFKAKVDALNSEGSVQRGQLSALGLQAC